MRRRERVTRASRVVCVLVAWLGVACAQVPHKGGFDEVQQLASEHGAGTVAWSTDSAEDDALVARTAPLLAGDLTADQAVEIALLRSPSLQAGYEELGIAQADLVQAALPANPVISGAMMPGLSGGLGRQQVFDLTQNLLGLLLLPARKELAATEFGAARLRVAGRVVALAAAVRGGYYDLVARQNLLASLRTMDAANAAAADYAARLQEAGNMSERAVTSHRSLREETRLAVIEAEAGVAESRARLARLLATRPDEEAWRVPELLPAIPANDPDLSKLETDAADGRLDVQAAGASTVALQQALDIARRWRWVPLVEVGVSSERQPEGGWNLGPSLALALPIFDQGQANVARLESELRRGGREREAARLDARSDVREAAARLVGARARAERLRNDTIPIRERLVRLTTEEYDYMLVGVFDLLLAKREELSAYRDYLAAVRDYWISFSELEGAVGRRIEVAAAPPDEPSSEPRQPHQHGDM